QRAGATTEDPGWRGISQGVACQAPPISARSGRCRGGYRAATQWPFLKTSFLPCASVTLYARVARDSAEAAVRARGVMGKDGRFDVAVTFDERRGYVGTHPELRAPVTALSLGGLRRKVEAAMLPEEVIVMLNLDKAARLERDRRRLTGRTRPGFAGTSA